MSVTSPFVITLTTAEKTVLSARTRNARTEHRDRLRARIVLAAAGGACNAAIAADRGSVRLDLHPPRPPRPAQPDQPTPAIRHAHLRGMTPDELRPRPLARRGTHRGGPAATTAQGPRHREVPNALRLPEACQRGPRPPPRARRARQRRTQELARAAQDPVQPEHRGQAHHRGSDPHDHERVIRLTGSHSRSRHAAHPLTRQSSRLAQAQCPSIQCISAPGISDTLRTRASQRGRYSPPTTHRVVARDGQRRGKPSNRCSLD